ncbi:uncharacterized protein LOC111018904 [Momordica charantia]|uniref:Uncharacterized protein LOC111018904 n=1 Tax=Momordica charantia TaxID=3673 RepID=A0A6J1DBB1_MOMCH|nr:uncharacterized protein LOC111018904 [Momordica charantia]
MCYFLTGLADETLTVKLGEEVRSTFAEVLQRLRRIDLTIGDPRGPYERYTPTTILISEILTNIEENGLEKLLKRPHKPRGDLKKCSKDRYCRFHHDHGHDTMSYWELKHQIEDLIQDGYFKKYVGKLGSSSVEKKQERKRSKTPPRRDDRPAVINTIFGGPSGGQSRNKRKELVREVRCEVCTIQERKPTYPISFSDSDFEGVHLPRNDALVISLLIDHVQVRKVLMDRGASANILSLTTYLTLRWTKAQLKKSPTPLVGFARESVTPKGCIDLPITIGQGDAQVTQMAEFVVIDGRSAYNAIFGRPIIHSLRAIPSTLH